MRDQLERITLSCSPIVDAAQHQRAAVPRLECAYFVECQPVRSDDSLIQFALRIVPGDLAGATLDEANAAVLPPAN